MLTGLGRPRRASCVRQTVGCQGDRRLGCAVALQMLRLRFVWLTARFPGERIARLLHSKLEMWSTGCPSSRERPHARRATAVLQKRRDGTDLSRCEVRGRTSTVSSNQQKMQTLPRAEAGLTRPDRNCVHEYRVTRLIEAVLKETLRIVTHVK